MVYLAMTKHGANVLAKRYTTVQDKCLRTILLIGECMARADPLHLWDEFKDLIRDDLLSRPQRSQCQKVLHGKTI